MAWESSVFSEALDTGSPSGVAAGAFRTLNPAEGVHVHATRTDLTPGDDWFLRIYASIDGAKTPDLPRRTWRMSAAQLEKDCSISGPLFSYYVEVGNAESSQADTVKVDVDHLRDGISL